MPAKQRTTRQRRQTKSTPASKRTLAQARPRRAGGSTYFVHPQGIVDAGAQVGQRTRVWAFSHVVKGAIVGADCNICECVFIENGVVLGDHVTVKNGVQLYMEMTTDDYVFIGPNATFTNDLRPRVAYPVPIDQYAKTHLAHGASIGANATIVAGHTIGRNALVGAGSVVIRDVPAHALVVGNPARQIGWVCECTTRLDASYACPACKKTYRRDDPRAGLCESPT